MELFGIGLHELGLVMIMAFALVFFVSVLTHLALSRRALWHKIFWAAIIIFVPVTGALLYYWFNMTDFGGARQVGND